MNPRSKTVTTFFGSEVVNDLDAFREALAFQFVANRYHLLPR